MNEHKLKFGLIINPWAGVGGKLAFKGSDGSDLMKTALKSGAVPQANEKVKLFLDLISQVRDKIEFVCPPLGMGEEVLHSAGFTYELVNEDKKEIWKTRIEKDPNLIYANGDDTREAAEIISEQGVDLLLFAGGDGTARDVFDGLASNKSILCLGIPCGVKIQSGVFALNPSSTAELVLGIVNGEILNVCTGEVRDLDEAKLRNDVVASRYYGEMRTPQAPTLIQCSKQGAEALKQSDSVELDALQKKEIADYLIDTFDEDCLYIIAPGGTTNTFKEALGINGSLLGVDAVLGGELIGKDLNTKQLLTLVKEENYENLKVILTIIGGQGCLFGRGNQQISPEIIKVVGKPNLIIIATPSKLERLQNKTLFADTGDPNLDRELMGLISVLVGYDETLLLKLI